jgi:hypothetical protein
MNTHNKNPNEKEPLIIHLSDDAAGATYQESIEKQFAARV